MISVVMVKELPKLPKLSFDRFLLRMKAKRKGIKRGDRSGTTKCQNQGLKTGITELVAVPVNLLPVHAIARAILWMRI